MCVCGGGGLRHLWHILGKDWFHTHDMPCAHSREDVASAAWRIHSCSNTVLALLLQRYCFTDAKAALHGPVITLQYPLLLLNFSKSHLFWLLDKFPHSLRMWLDSRVDKFPHHFKNTLVLRCQVHAVRKGKPHLTHVLQKNTFLKKMMFFKHWVFWQ